MFPKKEYQNHTIIVGCGRLGAYLANTLSDQGANAIVLDNEEAAFRKLDANYGGLTIVGDATDIAVLKEAGIEHADVVLSVTNNDNTNIMVAQIAKELYGTPRVVCRLYDPERECVYHEFGIDTICPAILSAKAIHELLEEQFEEGRV